MKFLFFFFYFSGSFLASWIRIRIPNPDPLTRLNPDPIGVRILNPEKSITILLVVYWKCRVPGNLKTNHFLNWYVKIRFFLYNFNFWKLMVPYLFSVDVPEQLGDRSSRGRHFRPLIIVGHRHTVPLAEVLVGCRNGGFCSARELRYVSHRH